MSVPSLGRGQGESSKYTQRHTATEWNVVVDVGIHSRAGQRPRNGGWSSAIKEKCQLLPYKGEIVEAVGLQGSVQPDNGMLLLMSAFTLQTSNRLRVELSNKKKMPVASLYSGEGGGSWPTQQHEGREWNVVVDFGIHS